MFSGELWVLHHPKPVHPCATQKTKQNKTNKAASKLANLTIYLVKVLQEADNIGPQNETALLYYPWFVPTVLVTRGY